MKARQLNKYCVRISNRSSSWDWKRWRHGTVYCSFPFRRQNWLELWVDIHYALVIVPSRFAFKKEQFCCAESSTWYTYVCHVCIRACFVIVIWTIYLLSTAASMIILDAAYRFVNQFNRFETTFFSRGCFHLHHIFFVFFHLVKLCVIYSLHTFSLEYIARMQYSNNSF